MECRHQQYKWDGLAIFLTYPAGGGGEGKGYIVPQSLNYEDSTGTTYFSLSTRRGDGVCKYNCVFSARFGG